MKRIFLIVLDSFGVGELPDAEEYGDVGSNTLSAVFHSQELVIPNMKQLGLLNLDGLMIGKKAESVIGAFGRMKETSKGKDTTTGHWEIGGLISEKPFPTFPNGFPQVLIKKLETEIGRKIICNKPYSGTQVIEDYGKEHRETGALIVYTSADSVLQIAAHEEVVPVEQLYQYCKIARKLCNGDYAVARVIARPFIGKEGQYKRTVRRHDFSLEPSGATMLDVLKEKGKEVIAVGKINDIFAGRGTTRAERTNGNEEGIEKTIKIMKEEFEGLCFTNLVDFDMLYGHRNNVDGYAKALTVFDKKLPDMMECLKEEDILIITADHGCDPSTPSTDHSREYTPLMIYGKKIKAGVNLGTRSTFADISATVLEYFKISNTLEGDSFLKEILCPL